MTASRTRASPKTASLLVIDGAAGFGNGRVMPAGPLREPAAAAAARCRAAILIGVDQAAARAAIPRLPVLDAWLVPDRLLAPDRVFAFCGIARPSKFFETVTAAGAVLAGSASFADHHPFSLQELEAVFTQATRLRARPLTTPKDHVRLPASFRPRVDRLGVRLVWRDEPALERLLDEVLA